MSKYRVKKVIYEVLVSQNLLPNKAQKAAEEIYNKLVENKQTCELVEDDWNDEKLECGHRIRYVVFGQRRNFCGICGKDVVIIQKSNWESARDTFAKGINSAAVP